MVVLLSFLKFGKLYVEGDPKGHSLYFIGNGDMRGKIIEGTLGHLLGHWDIGTSGR